MKRKQNTGFTLIELLMVVAVVAVLLTVATPYLGDVIKNGRIKSSTFDLLDGFNMARSEAVKNKRNVIICRSSNQTSCTGTANNWNGGWLIYIDENGNGSLDADDTILRTSPGPGGDIGILTTADAITYRPDGTVTQQTRLAICDDRGTTWGRLITVQPVGRANVEGGPDNPINSCTPS